MLDLAPWRIVIHFIERIWRLASKACLLPLISPHIEGIICMIINFTRYLTNFSYLVDTIQIIPEFKEMLEWLALPLTR